MSQTKGGAVLLSYGIVRKSMNLDGCNPERDEEQLQIAIKDPEIFTNNNTIVLKKYQPGCCLRKIEGLHEIKAGGFVRRVSRKSWPKPGRAQTKPLLPQMYLKDRVFMFPRSFFAYSPLASIIILYLTTAFITVPVLIVTTVRSGLASGKKR